MSSQTPIIHPLFHASTSTYQYLVADPTTLSAAIIDPVLDYDPSTNTVSTTSADAILDIVHNNKYTVTHLLETHAHADHLTAAYYLKTQLSNSPSPPRQICIGKRITTIQQRFAEKYGVDKKEWENVFDVLWEDGQEFNVGELKGKVIWLPGHTEDSCGYLFGENIFTGDSIFNPDVGSARCDFPGGDAEKLFQTSQTLLSFPENYKIYTGHDYPPGGNSGRTEPLPYTTVSEQQQQNKHLKAGTQKQDFVKWRTERDGMLGEPRLLHQALQVNIRGGRMPGDGFLKVPVKGLKL
ncbi:putative Zn-dependent hydrolase [Podospora fimiseda]|uniref:Zn-dependent hydrolase n=1 Tax=Podospora fimiseda TaxID=252190 RepID=A0AAN7BK73_9PEZI|nr:putative Zn-dependent hydrolase [Podospora fimiseda]